MPVPFFKLYAIALPTVLVIDAIWLGLVARGFYRTHLGHLMRSDIRWVAALAFYLLFAAAIVVFAVIPALERRSVLRAAALGGFLGLVAYATYDLTNYATLRDFPGAVVLVDILWGTAMSAAVASLVTRLAG